MDEIRETLIKEFFAALANGAGACSASDGRRYSFDEMRRLLQEWIPTAIEVKRACERKPSIVVAAPHVSFDNWTEYYANRVAHDLKIGEVLAKNFRDEDGGRIPVSIERHIHVNRPTESPKRGGKERVTPRARVVFEEYCGALSVAGNAKPLDLLIELHGHRRNLKLEVATIGVSEHHARLLKSAYLKAAEDSDIVPQLAIEPLDTLRFTARRAKANGSLSRDVCRAALHIEIPRVCRENEDARSHFRPILSAWLSVCAKTLTVQS